MAVVTPLVTGQAPDDEQHDEDRHREKAAVMTAEAPGHHQQAVTSARSRSQEAK